MIACVAASFLVAYLGGALVGIVVGVILWRRTQQPT